MSSDEIPFHEVIARLEDYDQPFTAKHLHYFSDLSEIDLALFTNTWKSLAVSRKLALLGDLDDIAENDTLMEFSSIGKVALTDQDDGVRESALRLLWECEDKSLLNDLIGIVNSDSSSRVRASAASLLGHFVLMGETDGISEAIYDRLFETLINSYKNDSDKLVRRRALESLGNSSRDEIVKILSQVIKNADNEWLASTLYAMGRSADPAWAKIILGYIEHNEDRIREEAVRAAGELSLADAREKLLEILEIETNDDIRAATIWSLSQIGGEDVREAITKEMELTQDEESLHFIEDALDNLNFTEELSKFDLIDIEGEDFAA